MWDISELNLNICTDAAASKGTTAAMDAYNRLASKMMVQKEKEGIRSFSFSGCGPGVGTTTVAYNTAIAIANAGRKTLLVDGDLRKGLQQIHKTQKISTGLSDYLEKDSPPFGQKRRRIEPEGQADENSRLVRKTNVDSLDYIPCGKLSRDPAALFHSDVFDAFLADVVAHYDFVLFDVPSLNSAAEAEALARKTGTLILVAGYMRTQKKEIVAAKEEIRRLQVNLTGILLNAVPLKKYLGKSGKKKS